MSGVLNNPKDLEQQLQQMFSKDQVYSAIGSSILVAVNPYKQVNVDTKAIVSAVKDGEQAASSLIALTADVYATMMQMKQDQSILYQGESGSGKSYSLNQSLQALAVAGKAKAKVANRIEAAQEILQAFGNARTVQSLSSSRYGQLAEVQFDNKGRLVGMKLSDYLLEKSRVTHVQYDERNFHAFYYMLGGMSSDEKAQWSLRDAGKYSFLVSGTKLHRTTKEDAQKYSDVKNALSSLGFKEKYQNQVFQLLAALLHLGNVEFIDNESKDDAALVKDEELLDNIAHLLGVKARDLNTAMVYKTKVIKKEICTVYLDKDEAVEQRDSLVQTLYSLLWMWLIESANKRLCAEEPSLVVNLVDLFGVDQLKENFFYQLMYNYTFERVLEFTNKTLFDDEVEKYHLEDVKFDASASYADNGKIVSIFTDPAHGILTRLNEESAKNRKRANADALLQEWTDFNNGNEFFAADVRKCTFTIRHHSQQVTYDAYDFVESNAQQISADFVTLFRGGSDIRPSKNTFLVNLFSEKALALERGPLNQIVGASQFNAPRRKPHNRSKSQKQQPETSLGSTFAGEFQQNLSELLDVVGNTKVSYVICISSNEAHDANKFDKKKVSIQLQDLGIPDIIKLKNVAYEISFPVGTLVEKFRLALPESTGSSDPLGLFAQQLSWSAGDYATGKTSIFLKDQAYRALLKKQRAAEKLERKRIKSMVNASGGQIAGSIVSSQNDDASDDGTRFSDNETADDAGSSYGSEYSYMSEAESTMQKKGEKGYVDEAELEPEEVEQEMTSLRKFWLGTTTLFTWWIPNRCLEWNGMKRADIQQAWREKLTLCLLIVLISCAMLFFITGFVILFCPRDDQLGWEEITQHSTPSDLWIAVHGMVFDYTLQVNSHSVGAEFVLPFGGRDASACFPYPAELCGLSESPPIALNESKCEHAHSYQTGLQIFNQKQRKLFKGYVAWTEADVKENHGKPDDWFIVIDNNVFDVTAYRKSGQKYLGPDVTSIIAQYPGQDVSQIFQQLGARGKPAIKCLLATSFVGQIDKRQTPQCQFANQILLAATVLLVSIIVVKFLSALQFGSSGSPEDNDRFVICQVPCYTEGEESLKRTIDSLANLKYDDKRKLLFIVADGNIIGSGNDRPSWRIALDLLGVDPSIDPPKLSFQSLGEGNLQHNMAKVYTGLYDISGHLVPYLLVAKVGKDNENRRPGNRGKRDSQMVLMRFLQKVHYDEPMSPLELEMYHQMKNVIGVDPSFYEFILMVDADTEVMPDALNRLVSAMVHDAKIVGLCGETTLANEKESFITMMQVYEYYISHHLAKSFESLFGSVTCLPGCFCMYRIRSPNKSIPLLISKPVVTDYAVNDIDTLHKKNLLSLGEDRYLTTLMLKHFPQMKLSFTRDAMARSIAPDRFNVLLSQRRRWINSTIHNLAELLLLPQLCGFCCFSMRFVVFFDLLATLVMPASILYLGYLIYQAIIAKFFPRISLYLICAAYGLQFIIFLLRGKFEMMGWMIIYILAIPLFSFFIPLYAFWHFDDFSWGNTRIVVGERGGKKQIVDEEPFDPDSIPVKKWSEYEQEMWENESEHTAASKNTGVTKHPNDPNYAFSGFSVHHGAPQQSLVGPFAPPADYGQAPQGVPPQYSQYSGSDNGVPMMQQRPVSMMPQPQMHQMMPAQPKGADYPSNEQITSQIKNYLATANLMTVTKKQVRDDLALFFNVDMSSRRDFINKVIEDVLQGKT